MNKLTIIAGPTAVGKTEYAIEMAEKIGAEIVSCDSMQLYKYMDVGTAKPSIEEMKRVKHHLIGVIDPREDFSVAAYRDLAKKAIFEIFQKGKNVIVTGGTGLYVSSLIYDMDFGPTATDWEYREKLEEIADSVEEETFENIEKTIDYSMNEANLEKAKLDQIKSSKNAGSHLLFEILKEIDTEAAERIHPNNRRKI
ncbi:MAG: tRNA (adenosine(37)-N6)-dimethylallyltransferase, partial [Anaerovoracaceae bacterium]